MGLVLLYSVLGGIIGMSIAELLFFMMKILINKLKKLNVLGFKQNIF